MKFKDKLKRFVSQPQVKSDPESAAPDATVAAAQQVWGGMAVDTELGSYWLIESVFDLEHRHGSTSLGAFRQAASEALSFLAQEPKLAGLPLEHMVFVDTETTGLAMGTGTLPFLIGLGWVEAESFVVRQYLVRDYPEEPAALAAVSQRLQAAAGLVSFNGKRFDWPLLKDRFMLNRVPIQTKHLVHLDLLYPARRLWRFRFRSCSLGSLETGILDVQRQADIPGSEVPQRYFDFLKSKQPELLQAVLHHNLLDILSLASLTAELANRSSLDAMKNPSAWELAGLARLHWQVGQHADSARCSELGLTLDCDADTRQRLLQTLGSSYKKLGLLAGAAQVYQELTQAFPGDLQAYAELAKYWEHQAKDGDAALAAAEAGLAASRSCGHRRFEAAFSHRRQRLQAKQASGRSVLRFRSVQT